MKETLANQLKVWRATRDLTQQQLAELVHVSRKTINTIEKQDYSPSVLLALKIAEVFDTTVEEIFRIERS